MCGTTNIVNKIKYTIVMRSFIIKKALTIKRVLMEQSKHYNTNHINQKYVKTINGSENRTCHQPLSVLLSDHFVYDFDSTQLVGVDSFFLK